MQFLHVEEAKHVDGFRVWLRFNDGLEFTVNLANQLEGPIFTPLKDPEYFTQFTLSGHTLSWPNGADCSPEYLHALSAN